MVVLLKRVNDNIQKMEEIKKSVQKPEKYQLKIEKIQHVFNKI